MNEIAAAGMASILVPLPFAADDHQRKNAEALVSDAGRRAWCPISEMNGERLFREVEALRNASRGVNRDAQQCSPVCQARRSRASRRRYGGGGAERR